MNSEISYNNNQENYNPEKNTSDKSNNILNVNLLLDNIRRNKVLIIIIGIVMFFASPFIEILARAIYYNSNSNYTRDFYEIANEEVLTGVFVLMVIVSILFGLCLAISGMRYMHNIKAAVFFGSIPVKKRIFFTTQCLSNLIYFTAPLIAAYLVSAILLPTYLTFITLTKIFSICWFIFLLVYSFTVMCANIAGTSFNTVISLSYLSVIVVILFFIAAAFTETFYRFTQVVSIDEITKEFMLPFIYFIIEIIEQWVADSLKFILIDMLVIFFVSAVFLFIGGLLNKINKTENAEKPFYFKISQIIFKYTILAIIAILSGIGFYQALQQNIFYLILGIIVGGFIAFLITNFIIFKSIREVFNGFKKFGIFIAAACIIITVASFDIFGIDKYIPETSKVESVEMNHNYYSSGNSLWYSIQTYNKPYERYNSEYYKNLTSDPETIELLNNILKLAMNSEHDEYYSQNISFSGSEIKYKLKNGQTVTKKIPYEVYFKTKSAADEYSDAVNKLYQNNGFKKYMFAPLTDIDYMENLINTPGVWFDITLQVYINRYDNDGENDYYWREMDAAYTIKFGKNEVMTFINKFNQDVLSDEFSLYNDGNDYYINLNIYQKLENGSTKQHSFGLDLNKNCKNTSAFIEEIIADKNYSTIIE